MTKKLLGLVLIGIMTITMLTACGNKRTTVEAPVEEEVLEEATETTEEPVEEETTEATEDASADTTLGYVKEDMTEEEPVEENAAEEFNQDVAMKKVERAIECYRKLVETKDEATWNLIDGMECLGTYNLYMDLRTSDGYYVYSDDGYVTNTAMAAIGNMYYEYANGIIDEVTPMSEYISYQTNNEILNKYNTVVTSNTDDTLMYTGITAMNYLNQAETIEAGDFIKLDTPAFVVNGTMNAVYKIPLIVDGEDSRLWAAFDENGMLIQISNEEDADWDKLGLRTFPNSEDIFQ